MVKVITYGTYDLLHYGHIRLLERAKKLGDYLIVGVTSEDFDKSRGKINVQQSLEERVSAVMATGIADKVIIEEYEGQKIDDIRKYDIDIFTVGSDWTGKFDYLKEYCDVVYLERTEGVSSSGIREKSSNVRLGLVGNSSFLNKFYNESKFVNAITVAGVYSEDTSRIENTIKEIPLVTDQYQELLKAVDAVYIHSNPGDHYQQCKIALENGKHVLCESPIAMTVAECSRLFDIAEENNCILMEAIRTAYLTAYSRLLLLLKTEKIGDVVSVDATCTSLSTINNFGINSKKWGALEAWGPTALLPVFQILGTDYKDIHFFSLSDKTSGMNDGFTKIDLEYSGATATVKVGVNVKSESELIISGTRGYAYVPAPWWKTDYFELRYEDVKDNKRFFYQVNGEGIRYELAQLVTSIRNRKLGFYIERGTTIAISDIMERKTVWLEKSQSNC